MVRIIRRSATAALYIITATCMVYLVRSPVEIALPIVRPSSTLASSSLLYKLQPRQLNSSGSSVNTYAAYEQSIQATSLVPQTLPQRKKLGPDYLNATQHAMRDSDIELMRVTTDYRPVSLHLELEDIEKETLSLSAERTAVFRQYGFDLGVSNNIPLDRPSRDGRKPACNNLLYPPIIELPQVSVIVIFYNEPLSTLLRNIVSILNTAPPKLLGEIVMVDDGSTLAELRLLEDNLKRLPATALKKVRLFRRQEHDGIVGARNRGAAEAVCFAKLNPCPPLTGL